MRILMVVTMDTEKFNQATIDGTAGPKMKKILDALKPDAAYFAENCGRRTGYLVVDMAKSSDLPRFCEPWFLQFNASIHTSVAMTPADLAEAGLDDLAKTYG